MNARRTSLLAAVVLGIAVLVSGPGQTLAAMDPGGIPHYFGPYPNWAYSPLPTGPVATVTVTAGGGGYSAATTVDIVDIYGSGSGALASATIDPVTGAITAIVVSNGGTGYTAPVVVITDNTGAGAVAEATIGGALSGGIRKFVDNVPLLGPAGANNLGQYLPVAVADTASFPGPNPPAADYYEIALVEFMERMHSDLPPTKHRGYVQLETPANFAVSNHVPMFNPDNTPILMPDGVTQAIAVDNPHFLGPVIVATGSVPGQPGRPVRLKFYNLLSAGAGGELFLPVDNTVMGAGPGPKDAMGMDCDPMAGMACEPYKQNRATVHLHGNNTVWISDGTTHQWITPAGESTPYPKGVSARNIPDMPDPGPGAATFYYTNAQSARLMFYHDHAMGITRLNVYAGEAAGYVLTDQVEQDMINGTNVTGVNPNGLKVLPDIGIPLVIQDRTFVDNQTIANEDPTWNWGTGPRDPATGKITASVTGDLWYPHVYMPAQNPDDPTGMNPFGRWHYGPWFWPPTTNIAVGPVPNPYFDPACDPFVTWCEPSLNPGTPNPSMAGEAFMDTPIVNGTAYPYLEVEPKAYRFRILNAADDRFLNLQFYVAADKNFPTTPGAPGTVLCDGTTGSLPADCTEVKMVSGAGTTGIPADWPSGLPDPATMGPDWIQVGTEGGFLPTPAVIQNQPITWNLNPTTFNFGNVDLHSLLLGTAERADVVVDFSAYAGKTLILYNDAPAAFPAGIPTYDYYTGAPDQTPSGGAPTPQPGFGPNTRTVMQIRVGTTVTAPTTDVTLANLRDVFRKTATKRGVFEVSQDPIIMPQAAYDNAYNVTNFPAAPATAYVRLGDFEKTFSPIDSAGNLLAPVTLPVEPKGAHDEMGGVYDTQFGRMSGMLGLEMPTTSSVTNNFAPYPYASPPVEIIKGSVFGFPVGAPLVDGTQIWKITHNGVDTHTIHTHLFNGQLVNRVAWDGALLQTDANELGWKDTFRMNPLEHIVIALKPNIPTVAQLPFEVPNSVRLIDPTLPPGVLLAEPPPAGWFDPQGNKIANIDNHEVNFGWEYVWHCHILAHEEMDMMHAMAFAVPPNAPSGLTATLLSGPQRVDLAWTDGSLNETGFTIQRAADAGFTTGFITFEVGANVTSYTDAAVAPNTTYFYRVFASNLVGDTAIYPDPSVGFPTMSADSGFSNTVTVTTALPGPAAPTNLAATMNANPLRITLTWTDASNNETSFAVWRSANGGAFAQIGTVTRTAAQRTATGGTVTFNNTTDIFPGNTYRYYVSAVNAQGSSGPSNTVTVNFRAPAAPTGLTGSAVRITGNFLQDRVTLNWTDNADNESGFQVQRSLYSNFRNPTTFNVGANVTTLSQNVSRAFNFYYRVRAGNAVGDSVWSNTVYVTTP